jgi:hypothetical protein
MTTDSTLPQSELGPAPANGQGQSQGHRRRRRRRKNKPSQPAAQTQQAQPQPAPVSQAPAAASPEQPPVQMARPPRQASQQQGGQQNQPRKKKKVFQKSAAPAPQPGNSISSPSQGKQRKSNGGKQQRGPREFVGPMDHSYRTVNGNIADGPASTIQISSNGGYGGHYQENFTPSPTVAVREGAVTRIFCFIEDLFFLAKIQETARKLGVKVEFVKGDKETLTRLTDLPDAEKPGLLVFDLNNVAAKPMTLIPKYKAKLKKATSIVGFLNHLQGDLKLKAVEAGCDAVMPRSAFSQTLPNLLRRYGMEDEEDNTPQPM